MKSPLDAANLIAELKRRRVFRAMVGYGIAAFAVLQIAEPIMHGLHWPDEVLSYIVVALALGFPVVVSLAWIFDVKAGRVETVAPAPGLRGVRLAAVLAGVGALGAAPGVVWYLVVRPGARAPHADEAKPASASPASESRAVPSIAVLPLVNLSRDPDQEYFSDGVAEEILNALAQVEGLHVAGRTSSFSFKGKNEDLRSIGQKLGVATVLEGSVRKQGDRVRITAQLINVADGFHLWSQNFDRELKDIFAMQEEIARAVVAGLKVKLAPGSVASGAPGGTRSPEAYEAYLLGRYHWNLRTTQGMIHATEAFKRAVALDPSYALAWTGLADADVLSVPGEYNVPGIDPDATLKQAEEAARRAIALAPRLGEAQASLGEILGKRDRFAEATAAFEQGIRLSPEYPTGHQWYSYDLQSYGRWDEAIREMETAHRLDPLSHVITLSLALVYDGAERFAEATPLYAQGLAQSPEAWYAWHGRVGHELALGHFDEAAAAYRRWLVGDVGVDGAAAAEIERRLRDPGTRAAMVDEILRGTRAADPRRADGRRNLGDVLVVIAYVRWLRGAEATVALLQKIAASGSGPDTLVLYTFIGPRLRADPRVQALAAKFGGPPPVNGAAAK